MSTANPLWGAPRIHGELLKLGIEVSQATVGRNMLWRPKEPSPTWRSFPQNHVTDIAAVDMFVVYHHWAPLCGHRSLIIIEDGSFTSTLLRTQRKPGSPANHRGVSLGHRTRYLLRDRDSSYAIGFRDRVRAMSIEEVVTAPRSHFGCIMHLMS
jgi:hypothetical protein